MKVTFLGHAAILIEAGGKSIVIDPWLKGNPQASLQPEELQVDAVLVTHGHSDHLGDTVEIAKNCDAPVVGIFELALFCQAQGTKAHAMSIGGGYDFDFGRVKMVPALHSSSIMEDGKPVYLGDPAGFVVQMGDLTVYHAGDTGLFGDMALIGEQFDIDLAILPIGDNFVMGPEDALRAIQMLMPKRVVPIHYNTFPVIEQDGQRFKEKVTEVTEAECIILKPGEHVEL